MAINLTVDVPVMRKDKEAMVSRILVDGSPLRICFRGVRIQSISATRGTVLSLHVPEDDPAIKVLQDIDNQAYNAVVDNNEEWFNNSLDEACIQQFFRASVTDDRMGVLVSQQREPVEMKWDTDVCASFGELVRNGIVHKLCTVEIEAQGIFFYPQRFGIRWVLRRIRVQSCDHDEIGEVVEYVNRADIEMSWIDTVEKTRVAIDRVVDELVAAKGRIECLLEEARGCPKADKMWNSLLQQLSGEIAFITCKPKIICL